MNMNMNTGNNVHVGVPPDDWESWESHFVHFHNFESLSCEKGHNVKSPAFSCCNHEWTLVLCPGGHGVTGSADGVMAMYLGHVKGPAVSCQYMCIIRDTSGNVLVEKKLPQCHKFLAGDGMGNGRIRTCGWPNFIERATIIDASKKALNGGTLTVEVRIKPDADHQNLNFIPKNEFAQNMLQSFMDEDTADIIFEVKGQAGVQNDVQFHAHKVVLQFCAKGSTLASLCEEYNKASPPVPILDISPQIFREMLYYIYGGAVAASEWKENAKDFIDAADRYSVKNLKIEAEAWYVKHLKITADNVVGAMLYAHEKSCFLLKETAINFMLKNGKEVLASDSFENIPESNTITREIISVAIMTKPDGATKDLDDPTNLSINELRARLYDAGKDIDGPRKRLIEELEVEQKEGQDIRMRAQL